MDVLERSYERAPFRRGQGRDRKFLGAGNGDDLTKRLEE
jgi:hypothetical protein